MHPSARTARRAAALLLCAGAVTVTACGSDSDGEPDPAAASAGSAAAADSTSNVQDTARVRLEECLREQGVELPHGPEQGGGPPADFDPDALQEALQGPCQDLAQGAFGDVSEADTQEFQDQFQAFRQCMAEQGVEVPDIRLGGGSHGEFDLDDPDVREAADACEDTAPTGGPFGSGPPGGG